MMFCTLTVWGQDATTWSSLKSAMEVEAGQSVTVTLTNNITRDRDEEITITGNTTLDLNGYALYGYDENSEQHYEGDHIFIVEKGGSLTITDNSTDKTGSISHVWGTSAIYVDGTDANSYGTLTLEAGTIGEAVRIYDYGRFTMTGGTINTNGATGVYLDENTTFTMTGGTITGNRCGVHIYDTFTTFTVSGNVNITGNTERDVDLPYDGDENGSFNLIHIGGALHEDARIGIYTEVEVGEGGDPKVITDGLNGNGTRENFVLKTLEDNNIALVNIKNEWEEEPREIAIARGYTLTASGNVTVNGLNPMSEGVYKVAVGEEVTLTCSEVPTGYTLDGYSVMDEDGNEVECNESTFTMPDKNVTVTVNWYEFSLTAQQATLNGVTKYWTTFYHPSLSYQLPNGAQAFYVKNDHALYLVGDGSIIPAGCAVIVMSDANSITLTKVSNPDPAIDVTGNILQGTTAATAVTDVYVLSKVGDDFGFFMFDGTIPANKAYYTNE